MAGNPVRHDRHFIYFSGIKEMSFRLLMSSLMGAMLAVVACGVLQAEDHGNSTADTAAEADPAHDEAAGHGDADHGDADHGHGAAHAAESGHGEHGHGDAHAAGHDPYVDATHGNAGPNLGKPEEWRMSLALWSLVVFLCLMGVLGKFAWGPITEALDQRELAVANNIAAAKEQNDRAATLLAEHEARMADTADEVRKIIDEARRDAETQKAGILAEAQAAADAEKQRAVLEIASAKNVALQEIAEKSVDTAVGLAGKIVDRQLTAEDHSSLIADAIKQFPSNN